MRARTARHVFALALTFGLAAVGAQAGVVSASTGGASTPTAEAGKTHCVSDAQVAGSTRAAADPVCFATFPEAIEYASDGAIRLPAGATTLTQHDVDRAATRTAAGGRTAATVVIGISRDNAEFPEGAGTWTHRAATGCDNDTGREHSISNVGDDWNDDIDSAEGFSGCNGRYYEHANFGGSVAPTPFTDASPMEDEASSIAWI